jgi:hypothetical protein
MSCPTCGRVSGTARESVAREAFKTLLKNWGRARDLIVVPEYEYTKLSIKPFGWRCLRCPPASPNADPAVYQMHDFPESFVSNIRVGPKCDMSHT